jgi:hypothetical protein
MLPKPISSRRDLNHRRRATKNDHRVRLRKGLIGIFATVSAILLACWIAVVLSSPDQARVNHEFEPENSMVANKEQTQEPGGDVESEMVASSTSPIVPTAPMDERTVWKCDASRFVRLTEKDWREDRGVERPFYFVETDRTPDYIELFDGSRFRSGISVRLYKSRVTSQFEERGENWFLLAHGGWQSTSLIPESQPAISLFNGRDFTGWKHDADTAETWKIERGELVGSGKHAILATEKEFKNFYLDAEISLRTVNSGLFFGGENGYECELCIPSSDRVNALGCILLNGQRNGRNNPRVMQRLSIQQSSWMQLQLLVDGNWISERINGEPIVNSFMEVEAEPGPIYFQQWWNSGSIAIRRILVKEFN